jgi:sulfur carrier protein
VTAPALVIEVNGASRPVPGGTTVSDVVAMIAPSPNGVAVALNGEVVPRSAWPSTCPRAGDRVEILSVAPGG